MLSLTKEDIRTPPEGPGSHWCELEVTSSHVLGSSEEAQGYVSTSTGQVPPSALLWYCNATPPPPWILLSVGFGTHRGSWNGPQRLTKGRPCSLLNNPNKIKLPWQRRLQCLQEKCTHRCAGSSLGNVRWFPSRASSKILPSL